MKGKNMKYIFLILLFNLQAQADDLVCSLKGEEYVTIHGLSQNQDPHYGKVRFKNAHPMDIGVNVTTLNYAEGYDMEGKILTMHRLIEASMLPYPTFHFKIEIHQVTGGHVCELHECTQRGIIYTEDGVEPLLCVSKKVKRQALIFDFNNESEDYCMKECGRSCLEKPIFCGQW